MAVLYLGGAVYSPAITDFTFMVKVRAKVFTDIKKINTLDSFWDNSENNWKDLEVRVKFKNSYISPVSYPELLGILCTWRNSFIVGALLENISIFRVFLWA